MSCDPIELAEQSGLGDELWAIHGPRILRKFEWTEDHQRLQNYVIFVEWKEAKRVFDARQSSAQRTNTARWLVGDRSVTDGGPSRSAYTRTGTGTGTKTEVQKPSRKRKADFSPTAQEVALYKAYPKHTAPNNAYRAIRKALVLKPFDELVLAVGAFSRKCSREGTEEKFIPHPASWFNAGRYDDEEFSRAKSSQASDPGAAYDRKVKAAMAEVRQ